MSGPSIFDPETGEDLEAGGDHMIRHRPGFGPLSRNPEHGAGQRGQPQGEGEPVEGASEVHEAERQQENDRHAGNKNEEKNSADLIELGYWVRHRLLPSHVVVAECAILCGLMWPLLPYFGWAVVATVAPFCFIGPELRPGHRLVPKLRAMAQGRVLTMIVALVCYLTQLPADLFIALNRNPDGVGVLPSAYWLVASLVTLGGIQVGIDLLLAVHAVPRKPFIAVARRLAGRFPSISGGAS